MERLTIDTNILFCDIAQCREVPGGELCKDGYCDQRRVYERLREYERLTAYEEKGSTTEDVSNGLELVEVYSIIRRLRQYEALGTIDDLTALAKARDEGRVVVLPCKVGATVWLTKSYFSCARFPIEGNYASIRGINSNGEILYQCITSSSKIERQFSSEDIGKTVFLTLAEAYAALGGGENS